jgi:hypothetical protein
MLARIKEKSNKKKQKKGGGGEHMQGGFSHLK